MVRAMTIARSNGLTLALLACCVVWLASCNRVNNTQKYANLNIILAYDLQTGNCTQTVQGDSQPTPFPDLHYGQDVIWVASNDSFAVRFPASKSPFAKNDFPSTYGAKVDSGPSNTRTKGRYPYNSVTINGKECQNSLELGFIMR
jgi:hypothetical protein